MVFHLHQSNSDEKNEEFIYVHGEEKEGNIRNI